MLYFQSIDKVYLEVWANDKEVQKALHVREGTVNTWQQNNAMLHYDLKKNDTIYYSYDIFSSVVYHKQLVDRNCQVLIINGDHDMNFPYVGTMEWISSLNLPIESPWTPWFVRNQVAGYRTIYTKNGYSLMHATVKGAGHSVALYKPEEASVIVDSWLASHTYSSDY
ncbi:putative peptidase S10, serine carboxypeptidase, alpha/Beta hydrolase [Helianthus debilis subsp. tardiflorus]